MAVLKWKKMEKKTYTQKNMMTKFYFCIIMNKKNCYGQMRKKGTFQFATLKQLPVFQTDY